MDKEIRSDTSNVETYTNIKKKLHENSTKDTKFIEALTQKYEVSYYNNNNSHINNNSGSKYMTSVNNNANNNNNNSNNTNNNNNNCNNNNNNNSNNINSNIISNNNNNTSNNQNSNEFWQMARLCMQRPINYETYHKMQQPATIQNRNNLPQIASLPTFYYHSHHQLLLSPNEQQQHTITPETLPATQQVYLHLQHQQAVQKSQHQFTNDSTLSPKAQPTTSHCTVSSSQAYPPEIADVTAYLHLRQNNHDNGDKPTRANGVG